MSWNLVSIRKNNPFFLSKLTTQHLSMKLLLTNTFTRKGKIVVFLSIALITGAPWWFISYDTFSNNPIFNISSVLLAGFCAAVLALFSNRKKRELILIVVAAHQLAFLIKVALDNLVDKTDHSLLPFEMIIFLCATVFAGIIGTIIGSNLRSFTTG